MSFFWHITDDQHIQQSIIVFIQVLWEADTEMGLEMQEVHWVIC